MKVDISADSRINVYLGTFEVEDMVEAYEIAKREMKKQDVYGLCHRINECGTEFSIDPDWEYYVEKDLDEED